MNLLASIIAALLVNLIKMLMEQAQARGDLERATLMEAQLDDAKRIQSALVWKAGAVADPASGDLRVQDGARAVPVPGRHPNPSGNPD